jgi:hypothetical protein
MQQGHRVEGAFLAPWAEAPWVEVPGVQLPYCQQIFGLVWDDTNTNACSQQCLPALAWGQGR